MGIQVIAVVLMLQYLMRLNSRRDQKQAGVGLKGYVLSIVLLMLFAGNILQMAIWAMLFVYLGEFSDFMTAFYHSAVNFSSLGYGDIVMNEKWRLLGALEASNGILMFGLSTGTLLAVMTYIVNESYRNN
jgi:hypothetical protein